MLKISIHRLQQVPRVLLIVFLLLLFLNILVAGFSHLTGHYRIYGLNPLFNFGHEKNIPTYFSTFNLLDEFVSIHERLAEPMRELFGITSGLFYFAWVIPGIFICIILFAFFSKFYWSLPSRYKMLFGISAFLFVSGAIVMEIINGFFVPLDGSPSLIYSLLATIEESLEMTGIIMFVHSLIDYIKSAIQTTAYDIS
jgi:hypothetical protein